MEIKPEKIIKCVSCGGVENLQFTPEGDKRYLECRNCGNKEEVEIIAPGPELKHCPFWRSHPRDLMRSTSIMISSEGEPEREVYWGLCEICNCTGPGKRTKLGAIEAWNDRLEEDI